MKYKLSIFLSLFLLNCFTNLTVVAQTAIEKEDPLELNGEWFNDDNTGFYSSLEFDSSTNFVTVRPFFGDELCYAYKLDGDSLILDDGVKKYTNFIFMKKFDDFMFFTTFLGGRKKTLFHKVVARIM